MQSLARFGDLARTLRESSREFRESQYPLMRHGLDKNLLSIALSPARPDRSDRRGAAGQGDGQESSFQLPSEAPAREPSSRDRRAAALARTPPAAGPQARDEASRPNTAARRSDPPRRDDPPRRGDGPRNGEEARRRDDPPRREDPPDPPRAEERGRPGKTGKAGATEEPREESSSEAETPDAAAVSAPGEPLLVPVCAPDIAQMPLAEGATPATPADEGEPVQIVAALKAPNPAEDTAGDTAGVVQGADDAAAPDQAEVATSEGSGSKEAESAAGKKRSGEVPSARDPAEKAKSEAAPEPAKSDPSAGKPIQATDAKPEPAPHGALPGLHSAAGKAAPEMRAPDAPPQAPVAHQVPLGAVPIEIGLKSLSGINRFEIRLDPAELGRIDVRLDIDESGEVKAHLVVDRVETLALLQRDAKTLERAFEQAGLKPSEGGVDLSLRDPSGDGRQQGQARDERSGQQADRQDVATGPERAEVAPAPAKRIHWRSTGVDLRI